MIYPINHDQQVLQQPARPATSADRQLAEALVATHRPPRPLHWHGGQHDRLSSLHHRR